MNHIQFYQDLKLPQVMVQNPFYIPYQVCYLSRDNERTQLVDIEAIHCVFRTENFFSRINPSSYKGCGFLIENILGKDAEKMQLLFQNAFSCDEYLPSKNVNVFILTEVYHENNKYTLGADAYEKLNDVLKAHKKCHDFIEWNDIKSVKV